MASSIFKAWLNSSEEDAKIFAEESLITDVLESIYEKMADLGVTKKDLAERLGTSKANISTVLGGKRNITLRTLSNICHALEITPAFSILEKKQIDHYVKECEYFNDYDIQMAHLPAIKIPKVVKFATRAPENGDDDWKRAA